MTALLRLSGMDASTGQPLTGSAHLVQSIRDILTTPIGSRVMRRDYGSLVPDLIDGPQNDVTRMQLMSAVVIALATWEPRITLSIVDVRYSQSGAVEAGLSGALTESMEQQTTTLTLRKSSNGNS